MLENKIVCITGASSGIGKACAQRYAKAGAKLLLCARRSDELNQFKAALQQQYATDIYTFYLDVRERSHVIDTFNALPESWQNIDILINNAGLAAGLDLIQEGSLQDWDDMIDTNVKGLLYVTSAILPQMVNRNTGHIINIGSIAGHECYPKGAVYCATKQAVNALSKGLRMDLFGTKIRVSTVDPGAVETNLSIVRFKGDTQRAAAVYDGMTPLQPEDVADAVFYCSSCPPHVNISEIIIMPTTQAAVTMIHRNSNK